jgi:hypothetical protein
MKPEVSLGTGYKGNLHVPEDVWERMRASVRKS